jgi:hypothetical protein
MSSVVRVAIEGNVYRVGDHCADSLGRLAVLLLGDGYPPGASIEAYRGDQADWAIRARTIRAAAEGFLVREGSGLGPSQSTHPRPRRGRAADPHKRSEAAS